MFLDTQVMARLACSSARVRTESLTALPTTFAFQTASIPVEIPTHHHPQVVWVGGRHHGKKATPMRSPSRVDRDGAEILLISLGKTKTHGEERRRHQQILGWLHTDEKPSSSTATVLLFELGGDSKIPIILLNHHKQG